MGVWMGGWVDGWFAHGQLLQTAVNINLKHTSSHSRCSLQNARICQLLQIDNTCYKLRYEIMNEVVR